MEKEKPKAYIVKMSVKNLDVQVDAEEINLVLQGIIKGQPIKVKRGIINPSFYVGIVEDVDRVKSYLQELNDVIVGNKNYEAYQIGERKALPEFKKLSDIFDGLKLTGGQKRIN